MTEPIDDRTGGESAPPRPVDDPPRSRCAPRTDRCRGRRWRSAGSPAGFGSPAALPGSPVAATRIAGRAGRTVEPTRYPSGSRCRPSCARLGQPDAPTGTSGRRDPGPNSYAAPVGYAAPGVVRRATGTRGRRLGGASGAPAPSWPGRPDPRRPARPAGHPLSQPGLVARRAPGRPPGWPAATSMPRSGPRPDCSRPGRPGRSTGSPTPVRRRGRHRRRRGRALDAAVRSRRVDRPWLRVVDDLGRDRRLARRARARPVRRSGRCRGCRGSAGLGAAIAGSVVFAQFIGGHWVLW